MLPQVNFFMPLAAELLKIVQKVVLNGLCMQLFVDLLIDLYLNLRFHFMFQVRDLFP